ncbi:Putative peptidoglycan binding domain protein (fragment) [Sphingomonas aurantiaca]|uniref:Peptidoglycan binding domain protein n=2 Tax=Sphingomonas aurantiaca TaxID=185949 RepID=A0A5E8AGK1_9SPHN
MKTTFRAMLAASALTFLTLPTMAQARPSTDEAGTLQSAQSSALWNDANRSVLKTALADRERHGLDHIMFLPDDADQRSHTVVEKAYTQAALAYAQALAQGAVDPASLHDVYTISRPTADLGEALSNALRDGVLEQWLGGLAPSDDEYRKLSDAYLAANRDTAKQVPTIALTKSIHVGDTNPQVPEIANQLVDDGYLKRWPRLSEQARGLDKWIAAG